MRVSVLDLVGRYLPAAARRVAGDGGWAHWWRFTDQRLVFVMIVPSEPERIHGPEASTVLHRVP